VAGLGEVVLWTFSLVCQEHERQQANAARVPLSLLRWQKNVAQCAAENAGTARASEGQVRAERCCSADGRKAIMRRGGVSSINWLRYAEELRRDGELELTFFHCDEFFQPLL
jgi:hypothetical protein